jgi:carbamate kinase
VKGERNPVSSRVLIALGGNALLRRGEAPDWATQVRNVARAAEAIAAIAMHHGVIVTHGNGPQVGLLALRSAMSPDRPDPLDLLNAETEGMIGYLIEQALRAELPDHELATLLTQVEVDADDPAFGSPTKPIGPVYGEAEGRARAREHGWKMASEPGGLRRVVPSPVPRRILELPTIRRLADAGVLLICAGGGGIPVTRTAGHYRGVEAVVDKDHTAALLAGALEADYLLLLTDVAAVYRDWPDTREPLAQVSVAELRALSLDPGSMGPKAAAACRFVAAGGGVAAIGALEDAPRILVGAAGTRVT